MSARLLALATISAASKSPKIRLAASKRLPLGSRLRRVGRRPFGARSWRSLPAITGSRGMTSHRVRLTPRSAFELAAAGGGGGNHGFAAHALRLQPYDLAPGRPTSR